MKIASSDPTSIFMPSGRIGCSVSISARTALEIATVLACDWRSTPSPIASTPFALTWVSSFSTPRATVAMSPSFTG